MICAPVCIPTLNRYNHLRKCLESLSKCTWADKTDVYVALDYPPLDKWDYYVYGWKQNQTFLRTCGNLGFKKLHVVERTENYGIWDSKRSNISALINEVIEPNQYFIFSEDDNVFSPSFLDYMNHAIERYKDDKSVFGICGYKHPYPIKYDNNSFFRQNNDFSAWGSVIFYDKFLQPDYKWFRKMFTFNNIEKIHKHGRYRLAGFIRACEKTSDKFLMIDNGVSILAPILDMDFIMPTTSLVRNIGVDGSGINFTSSNLKFSSQFINQEISQCKFFQFTGTGFEHYEENKQIFAKCSWGEISRWKFVKTVIKAITKRIING